jgi:hypothetical protein
VVNDFDRESREWARMNAVTCQLHMMYSNLDPRKPAFIRVYPRLILSSEIIGAIARSAGASRLTFH